MWGKDSTLLAGLLVKYPSGGVTLNQVRQPGHGFGDVLDGLSAQFAVRAFQDSLCAALSALVCDGQQGIGDVT